MRANGFTGLLEGFRSESSVFQLVVRGRGDVKWPMCGGAVARRMEERMELARGKRRRRKKKKKKKKRSLSLSLSSRERLE